MFKNIDITKLKKSILISLSVYIISIYIAILTKSSSRTYIEGLGYKGWFESGNSLSAILTLGLFIILPMIKEKKYRYYVLLLTTAVGIFQTMLIGTRVGLYGFILVLATYAASEIIIAIIHKKKLNKILLEGITLGIIIIIAGISIIGSNTLRRRQHLESIEGNIKKKKKSDEANISGSLLKLKEQIENGEINTQYMSEPAQKSILDLYNYADEHNVTNNDMRRQQLIYNIYLVKNQANPFLVLFGNGYLANFRELVLEVELIALITNFGLIGFLIYFVPFLSIFIYSMFCGYRNIRKLDVEYFMILRWNFL